MKIIVQKIPCDSMGNIENREDLELNSKNCNNYNHKKSWDKYDRSITNGKEFDFFPRGRIEIKNGVKRRQSRR